MVSILSRLTMQAPLACSGITYAIVKTVCSSAVQPEAAAASAGPASCCESRGLTQGAVQAPHAVTRLWQIMA
jgi:hypothetical protein